MGFATRVLLPRISILSCISSYLIFDQIICSRRILERAVGLYKPGVGYLARVRKEVKAGVAQEAITEFNNFVHTTRAAGENTVYVIAVMELGNHRRIVSRRPGQQI